MRRVPIKSVDQGLPAGRKQRNSLASLGDSANLTGSLGCPCPPGIPRARGSLSHARWVRHWSLDVSFWHSSSCQWRRKWSRIECLGYPGQTLSCIWKPGLEPGWHLCSPSQAHILLMGAPGVLHYQETTRRLLGSEPLGAAVREHARHLFPILFCCCTAFWPPDAGWSSRCHGARSWCWVYGLVLEFSKPPLAF